jgi:co-chaperonin GroES (HSP10)
MGLRRIRKVSPLGMRVVVSIEKDSPVTESGLYLPEGAKEALKESILAEVIEVASAHDAFHDEETNVSGIPLGARVLILKDCGIRLPWDDTSRIVEVKDILAIVDEVNLV